jgi:hypothetical protein
MDQAFRDDITGGSTCHRPSIDLVRAVFGMPFGAGRRR